MEEEPVMREILRRFRENQTWMEPFEAESAWGGKWQRGEAMVRMTGVREPVMAEPLGEIPEAD